MTGWIKTDYRTNIATAANYTFRKPTFVILMTHDLSDQLKHAEKHNAALEGRAQLPKLLTGESAASLFGAGSDLLRIPPTTEAVSKSGYPSVFFVLVRVFSWIACYPREKFTIHEITLTITKKVGAASGATARWAASRRCIYDSSDAAVGGHAPIRCRNATILPR